MKVTIAKPIQAGQPFDVCVEHDHDFDCTLKVLVAGAARACSLDGGPSKPDHNISGLANVGNNFTVSNWGTEPAGTKVVVEVIEPKAQDGASVQ